MARFPRSPGAGLKGMNNPVYWTRMHLQNERYRATSQAAIERFNERWNRLQDIEKKITEDFILDINGLTIKGKKATKLAIKLMKVCDELALLRDEIRENIEIAKNSDLSKYATQIKNAALCSIGICIELDLFSDLDSVEYVAKEKMIYINDEEYYYLG